MIEREGVVLQPRAARASLNCFTAASSLSLTVLPGAAERGSGRWVDTARENPQRRRIL